MLRVQRERQRQQYFPSVREYSRLFGLTRDRVAMLPEGGLIMHPGPMNRGVEIDSDVADLPQVGDRGAGDERDRGPDVPAVPAARRARGPARRGGADGCLTAPCSGGPGWSTRPRARRGRRRPGRGGGSWRVGEVRSGAHGPRLRPAWSSRRGSSTCTPTCASRGARTRRRSRPGAARRRSAGTRRWRRWPTPTPSPTTQP